MLIENQQMPHSIRDISDERAVALSSLSLTNTYLISGGMLFSCCILPLLYFWFCHPVLCKFFGIIKTSKQKKLSLEETQVDEVEFLEFVPDEAPDRINIRCDPIFDDVKVKVFHRRHHHLIKPSDRRRQQQQQNAKKSLTLNKVSKERDEDENINIVPEEKTSNVAEISGRKNGAEQATSTEITFSHQMQYAL